MLTIAGAALIAANPGSTVLEAVGIICFAGALWAFGLWGTLWEGLQGEGHHSRRMTAPRAGIASEPLSLSERLVAFYREGERLQAHISHSILQVPGDLVRGVAAQRQVAREQLARDWDGRVLDALTDDDRPKWTEAGTLPVNKLDYVTTIAGVRTFLAKKLACLKEIIGQLDEDQ